MKARLISISILFLFASTAKAQSIMRLDSIFRQIEKQNPRLKMSDATVRSMDEMAKGAYNWEAPELGTGLWMVPYNPSLWKKGMNGSNGMGQYALSAQQMLPNKKKQNAEYNYLEAASSVEKENKKATLNDLFAQAKTNYFEWQMDMKKDAVLVQNEKLLTFMIKDTEIRYKNGLDKLSAYYKAQAALGNIQNMRIMLVSEIQQKRTALNTLMNRSGQLDFQIDTLQLLSDYSVIAVDTSKLASSRSDVKAIERNIQLTQLKQNMERSKLKPEFGVRYEHMFGFGGLPMQYTLMGMVKIPMSWSTKAQKATIESLKWEAESLNQQKQSLINESSGMAYSLKNEIAQKKKQISLFEINIIPALRRNYQTMQIAYQQNTEELFMLYDAWETLNMMQLEYLEQVKQALLMQIELERIVEISQSPTDK
ncbi:MAG TPA: TolC family protein [Sphingobacteriaceae bacterium]|nr:TolC family protein [Sphingobacteriaceae bacterium]